VFRNRREALIGRDGSRRRGATRMEVLYMLDSGKKDSNRTIQVMEQKKGPGWT
jgi:hypothetical protein